MRQFAGARRYVHIAGPLDKLPQHAEGFLHVLEGVFGQQLLPFGFGALELSREGRDGPGFARVGLEQPVEDPAHVVCVGPVGCLEVIEGWETHQTGQALLCTPVSRNRVRLAVILHLE